MRLFIYTCITLTTVAIVAEQMSCYVYKIRESKKTAISVSIDRIRIYDVNN